MKVLSEKKILKVSIAYARGEIGVVTDYLDETYGDGKWRIVKKTIAGPSNAESPFLFVAEVDQE